MRKLAIMDPVCLVACFVVSAAYSSSADAYCVSSVANGTNIKWNFNNLILQVHSDAWDDADARDVVVDSVNLWEDNPSNFWFSAAEDNDGWALSNNESELAYTNSAAVLGGAPAITYTRWYTNSGQLVEADVFMSTNVTWSNSNVKSDIWPYGGSARPGQTTLIHELGHALGLCHVNTLYNIMGQDWDHIHANSNTATAYAGEDAFAGARVLYGEYEPYEDLSVAHWRHTGASGEYSTHDRARILNNAGAPLPLFSWGNEPYYILSKGSTYRPEVMFENNGGDGHCNTDVSYRLSTNSWITTWDTELLRISNICWQPDAPFLATYSVKIPNSVATGTYWLGVITDVDEELSPETRDDNNGSYIARVRVE